MSYLLHRNLARSRSVLLVACAVSAFGTNGCAGPAPRPEASSPLQQAPIENIDGLVEAHNRARARAGLPPLEESDRLKDAARKHADDMAGRRRMSHRGGDGSSPFRRIEREGYRFERAGENVAYGQETVEGVMAAWMASPGHRRNVLGRYREIGAACATDAAGTRCWCVTFGSPAPR